MKLVYAIESRVGVTIMPREIMRMNLEQLARACEQRGQPLGEAPIDEPSWLTRITRKLGLN